MPVCTERYSARERFSYSVRLLQFKRLSGQSPEAETDSIASPTPANVSDTAERTWGRKKPRTRVGGPVT